MDRNSIESNHSENVAYEQAAENSVKITSDAYVYVGRKLRELRVKCQKTQADIASVISVSPQQYQKYEDAQSKCSLTNLFALADHYGVHINELLPVEAQNHAASAGFKDMANEADLLARLVSSFVKMAEPNEKLRLVQLVEAIVSAQEKQE